jgi:DNA-binding CsgD family transcriptional regulator
MIPITDKKYLLTVREKEVLDLLLTNHSNRQIAEKLFIDYETIRSHRKNIYRKLEVKTILELVMGYYVPSHDF